MINNGLAPDREGMNENGLNPSKDEPYDFYESNQIFPEIIRKAHTHNHKMPPPLPKGYYRDENGNITGFNLGNISERVGQEVDGVQPEDDGNIDPHVRIAPPYLDQMHSITQITSTQDKKSVKRGTLIGTFQLSEDEKKRMSQASESSQVPSDSLIQSKENPQLVNKPNINLLV